VEMTVQPKAKVVTLSDRSYLFLYDNISSQRLDKFLVSCLPELSRTRLQNLIRDGFVSVNGQTAEKTGVILDSGCKVSIHIPPVVPTNLVPEKIDLEIIFENNDLMVVNKPAGMVVHPAAGHAFGTLVQAAMAHAPEMEGISGEQRPGIVHRLDKDTSGLILIAKNDFSHHWLTDQFIERKVNKIYLALVDGHPPTPQGRIETPIGRDPVHRQRMAIVPQDKGRAAITEYQCLERFPHYELLRVHPITGRTHQIRLHLAFIHCPVVGDTVYGHRHPSLPLKRFFLHAGQITLTIPGEETLRTFEAPLPPELEMQLNILRRA
jgi:23S rRNA pseudouridine1911/1915/1917 synthase